VGDKPDDPHTWEELRRHAIETCMAARASGDAEGFANAALALPAVQRFGTHPGAIPALLFEAYVSSADGAPATRARLAAALARAWVYGGEADRARQFANEAEALASDIDDRVVLADALDASLLAHWGPDDHDERQRLAVRLGDTVAHVTDLDVQLSGYLWRLTSAWECLDLVAVQRQLRALDAVAAEFRSTRAEFFAVSRRAMYELAVGSTEATIELIERARGLGERSGEPDALAVHHALAATHARQSRDVAALRREAAAFEDYGRAEGITSVCAEAAVFRAEAGALDAAEALVRLVAGDGLHRVNRDVDFLLTVGSIVRASLTLGLDDVTAEGAALLEPYAGRAIVNAGAVTFHGVVDDYLACAHRSLGDTDPTRWIDAAERSYRRIGAAWWLDQLAHTFQADMPRRRPTVSPSTTTGLRTVRFQHQPTGPWTIGEEPDAATFPDLRGLHYVRELLAHPGEEISCLELASRVHGHPGPGVYQTDLGEILDAATKAAYRRRIDELDAELAEAEEWADIGRLEIAENERQAVIEQLTAAAGLGGRRRRAGAHDERARVAVRKAITAAVTRIEQHDPRLARILHLTIRTGTACRYEPDPDRPVRWILESPPRVHAFADEPRHT